MFLPSVLLLPSHLLGCKNTSFLAAFKHTISSILLETWEKIFPAYTRTDSLNVYDDFLFYLKDSRT